MITRGKRFTELKKRVNEHRDGERRCKVEFYMRFLYLPSFINQIQDIDCKINGRISKRDILDLFGR